MLQQLEGNRLEMLGKLLIYSDILSMFHSHRTFKFDAFGITFCLLVFKGSHQFLGRHFSCDTEKGLEETRAVSRLKVRRNNDVN